MLNNPTPYIYPCLYQKSLSLTISISKLAYASGFRSGFMLWLVALAGPSLGRHVGSLRCGGVGRLYRMCILVLYHLYIQASLYSGFLLWLMLWLGHHFRFLRFGG